MTVKNIDEKNIDKKLAELVRKSEEHEESSEEKMREKIPEVEGTFIEWFSKNEDAFLKFSKWVKKEVKAFSEDPLSWLQDEEEYIKEYSSSSEMKRFFSLLDKLVAKHGPDIVNEALKKIVVEIVMSKEAKK
ncbi:MAG: hypothetical protein QW134_09290 [Nitrososphaeria archaeon]